MKNYVGTRICNSRETKRKDIKYQLKQRYKLQTIMHYVNKETFDFIGFTFSNGMTLTGKYRPNIRTNKKRLKQSLK